MVKCIVHSSVQMRHQLTQWVDVIHVVMFYYAVSMDTGSDGRFIQWSIHKTGKKIAEYSIHGDAHQPLYQWTETGSHASHTREVTKANLFALEAEGHHILTAGAKQAVIYQVRHSQHYPFD